MRVPNPTRMVPTRLRMCVFVCVCRKCMSIDGHGRGIAAYIDGLCKDRPVRPEPEAVLLCERLLELEPTQRINAYDALQVCTLLCVHAQTCIQTQTKRLQARGCRLSKPGLVCAGPLAMHLALIRCQTCCPLPCLRPSCDDMRRRATSPSPRRHLSLS